MSKGGMSRVGIGSWVVRVILLFWCGILEAVQLGGEGEGQLPGVQVGVGVGIRPMRKWGSGFVACRWIMRYSRCSGVVGFFWSVVVFLGFGVYDFSFWVFCFLACHCFSCF